MSTTYAILSIVLGTFGQLTDIQQVNQEWIALNGNWSLVSSQFLGKQLVKDKPVSGTDLTIENGKVTVHEKDFPKHLRPLLFTINLKHNPKTATATFVEQNLVMALIGIYRIQGDALTVCLDCVRSEFADAKRPKRFDGNEGALLVFKRNLNPTDADLNRLIRTSLSIGEKERREWVGKFPLMTPEQRIKLKAILIDERIDRAKKLVNAKEYANAASMLEGVLAEDPRNAFAYYLRAHAFLFDGEPHQAIDDYSASILLDPNNPGPCNALAWLMATHPDDECRNGNKAIAYATKACELTKWEEPTYLDTLAAAYAEAGHFGEAVRWQEKALGNAKFEKKVGANEFAVAKQRLQLFKQGKPFREP
jgi:uncharacterized protein (TIGR03067 family)